MKAKEPAKPANNGISGLFTQDKAITLVLVLILLGVVFLASQFALSLSHRFLYTYGIAGLFLLYVISAMSILIPIPADAALLVLVKVYPPELLALIAGIGASIGECSSYVLGYFGHAIMDGHEFTKAQTYFRKYGFFFVFGLAVFPAIPFDVVGLTAGYLKLPFLPFLGATMAGKVAKYYVIARTGNAFFDLTNQ